MISHASKRILLSAIACAGLCVLPGARAATKHVPATSGHPAAWSTPVKPFRIAGSIYYVGTKGLAAYLLVSRQGAVLLDGTLATNAVLIEHNIEALGVSLQDVKLLIADHAHFDHVGALARIKADTGAELVASAGDRWALEHGRPRGQTSYPEIDFPAVKVDSVVGDGESRRLGDVVLTAHLTPGHTPGCTSWSTSLREGDRSLRVLFPCSLTVAGNVLVGNRAYPDIAADYLSTFDRLDTMKADIVLTSHPELSDVLGREARRDAGDANAFIDPGALARIVAAARAEFDRSLAKAGASLERKTP